MTLPIDFDLTNVNWPHLYHSLVNVYDLINIIENNPFEGQNFTVNNKYKIDYYLNLFNFYKQDFTVISDNTDVFGLLVYYYHGYYSISFFIVQDGYREEVNADFTKEQFQNILLHFYYDGVIIN